MTTTAPPSARTTRTAPWRADLEGMLRPECFPARQDELLATLLRHRAPSSLLWRLACLPRTRRFTGVEEVCAYIEDHAHDHTVGEPL